MTDYRIKSLNCCFYSFTNLNAAKPTSSNAIFLLFWLVVHFITWIWASREQMRRARKKKVNMDAAHANIESEIIEIIIWPAVFTFKKKFGYMLE